MDIINNECKFHRIDNFNYNLLRNFIKKFLNNFEIKDIIVLVKKLYLCNLDKKEIYGISKNILGGVNEEAYFAEDQYNTLFDNICWFFRNNINKL